MRICNIVFKGEVPEEIFIKAALTECKYFVNLPRRVKVIVYYDPDCPACKRLFIFMMEIGNLEVEAAHFSEGVNIILQRVNKLVIPFTVIDNGRWLRGCPRTFNEFYEKLLNIIK
ncbi:MAG: hypothetical protein DRJ41_00450 [Thermoprotei archaeon]|nr:MAG: hypothetical protein DRJ41_00450 [Thermoprotei archaeon]